jgi:hypothetical protein
VNMSVYELLTISVALASGIIVPIFLAYRPEHVPFKLIRHDSSVKESIESKTALEVSHPDKTIERCKVIYNGHELFCDESNSTRVTVLAQGTALSRIPTNTEDEESKVIVKNGRHTIRKEKMKEIEYHKVLPLSGSDVPNVF